MSPGIVGNEHRCSKLFPGKGYTFCGSPDVAIRFRQHVVARGMSDRASARTVKVGNAKTAARDREK